MLSHIHSLCSNPPKPRSNNVRAKETPRLQKNNHQRRQIHPLNRQHRDNSIPRRRRCLHVHRTAPLPTRISSIHRRRDRNPEYTTKPYIRHITTIRHHSRLNEHHIIRLRLIRRHTLFQSISASPQKQPNTLENTHRSIHQTININARGKQTQR